jgi:plasmid stabilization system protein ParE
MARKVVWTETAWCDLEHIADYIATDSPGYAAAFVSRIRDQASSLAALSLRGRMVPELGEPAVRELLVGNYRLIYEVHEKTTYILGLIHGARDLAALWAREERSEPDRPS